VKKEITDHNPYDFLLFASTCVLFCIKKILHLIVQRYRLFYVRLNTILKILE